MKIIVTYSQTIEPGRPECDEVIALMTEHTLHVLEMKGKYILKGIRVPVEDQEKFRVRRIELGKLFAKCFADNPFELDNIHWESEMFVSKEQATILVAPEG